MTRDRWGIDCCNKRIGSVKRLVFKCQPITMTECPPCTSISSIKARDSPTLSKRVRRQIMCKSLGLHLLSDRRRVCRTWGLLPALKGRTHCRSRVYWWILGIAPSWTIRSSCRNLSTDRRKQSRKLRIFWNWYGQFWNETTIRGKCYASAMIPRIRPWFSKVSSFILRLPATKSNLCKS